MTTHAFFPALDAEHPATFSEEIVGLLKNEIGFSGTLLTDDLEMGAIVKNYPLGEAAVEAVRAGHDLALICRRREYVDECRQALGEALRSGRLSEARLADAHERSGRLARRLADFWPDRALRDQWFEALTSRRI
jgi:beta-N-acetylhexosaminidase